MRLLLRLALLLGCCELLPLTRRTFGLGFALGLGLVFILKHQLLVYVPASQGYQLLNHYAAMALAVHLLGRFVFSGMAVRHAGVPGAYPGLPWLCYVGISDQAAQLYGEPLLALVTAVLMTDSPLALRFQPLFFLEGLPLPYGIITPYPDWYTDNAELMALTLPFVSTLALVLYNRLDAPAPVRATPHWGRVLTFSDVQLPPAPELPSPSAAAMTQGLSQGGHTRGSE